MEWVVAGAVGYGAIVGLAFAFQRSLLYFPWTETPDPAAFGAADMAVVRYPAADGLDLAGWYRAAEGDRPTILYFHGNGGHLGLRADKVRPLLDAGYGLLLAGYRGYGGNPGHPSEAGLIADGRGALDWLAGQGVPAERVVLYGESLGGGVAVPLAVAVPVAGLVLEAPFTSIAEVAQRHYPFLPARWLVRDRYDNLSAIGRIRSPLLVIHGERDEVTPFALGRRLFDAAPEPRRLAAIPGGRHNDLHARGAMRFVLEFLAGLRAP